MILIIMTIITIAIIFMEMQNKFIFIKYFLIYKVVLIKIMGQLN